MDIRLVPVSFEVRSLPTGSGPPAGFSCSGCGGPLDWSQPDRVDHGRLLGACPACREWHLLELSRGARRVIFVRLPGGKLFREPTADGSTGDGRATVEGLPLMPA